MNKEPLSDTVKMTDADKTKEELIQELSVARGKIAEIETLKAECKRVESIMRQAVIMTQEEKTRTDAIIAAIGDGISVQDTNFIVLLQNQFHKDMVGEHVGEFCYKAYQNRETVCEGCHLAMSFMDGRVHKKEQFRSTDKGTFYYEITSSPLKDPDGRIIAGIEAVRDITERKKTEQALLSAEARFRTLVEQSFVGIYILQDARIIYSNPKLSEIFGYAPEELLLKSVFDLVADESRALVAENVRRRVDGELKTVHYIFRGKRKDGSLFDVEAQGATTELNGRVAIIGSLIDITERRRLERENLKAQKLASLGILAAGIAHEYNNALTAINGNIGLAKMYVKAGSEMSDILLEAEKAAQKAERLTQELRIFSKGGVLFKKVAAVSGLLREIAQEKADPRIKYTFEISPDLWTIEADEPQFRQAVCNIVENARDSMPEGGTIRITAENVAGVSDSLPAIRAGRYVRFSISDQGSGIAETHMEKIFEPFFTTKEQSSGLGLTTASSIIEGHDGYITVESSSGSGAIFHIYMPAATVSGGDEVNGKQLSLGNRRILVMDDEELVRTVAERMLNQCGCAATFAADGREMLAKYREALEAGRPFDAVIVDLLVASGMGGKEAIAELLSIDPAAKAIVSSGYSDDPIMENYREFGFRGVLPKPYLIPALRRVLHDVIIGPS